MCKAIDCTHFASPLRFCHTSNVSYRIWYYGVFNTAVLCFKETYCEPNPGIEAYIEHAKAVRIDIKTPEYDWVTIWLTDIRYAGLQGGVQ